MCVCLCLCAYIYSHNMNVYYKSTFLHIFTTDTSCAAGHCTSRQTASMSDDLHNKPLQCLTISITNRFNHDLHNRPLNNRPPSFCVYCVVNI